MRHDTLHNSGSLKPHSNDPIRRTGTGNGGWKQGKSGLRPMKPEREEQVWREVEMRRKGA